MKKVIALLAILFNTCGFASEGVRFCPYPSSFHYDDSEMAYTAPGNWHLRIYRDLTNPKIVKFKSLMATSQDGRIIGCTYEVRSDASAQNIEMTAVSDIEYIADNMQTVQWHNGSYAICDSDTPLDCPFHQK